MTTQWHQVFQVCCILIHNGIRYFRYVYIFIKVVVDNYLTIWSRFHFFSILHILVPQCMYMYMQSILRSRRPLVTYQLIAFVKCNRVEENTVLNQTDWHSNKCLRFRNCLLLQVECSISCRSISWNSNDYLFVPRQILFCILDWTHFLYRVTSSNYTTIVLFRETVIEIKLHYLKCNFNAVGRKKAKTVEQDELFTVVWNN